MYEFDPTKPSCVQGHDGVECLIQDGRTYYPHRNGPPRIAMQIGAMRTKGGGKIFICVHCGAIFDTAPKLGRHYKEYLPCKEEKRVARNKVVAKYIRETRPDRTIKKILGDV